jgi:hypothetical protein
MLKAFIPALLLIAAAAPAGATCKQADIAGTWTAYSIGKAGQADGKRRRRA